MSALWAWPTAFHDPRRSIADGQRPLGHRTYLAVWPRDPRAGISIRLDVVLDGRPLVVQQQANGREHRIRPVPRARRPLLLQLSLLLLHLWCCAKIVVLLRLCRGAVRGGYVVRDYLNKYVCDSQSVSIISDH